MLAPGALFGFYRWGNTVSSVGPALSERPLIVRELVPYADQRAAGLQATVDDLVQQGRLVPGQFAPLLQLMAVGEVVVNADGLPLQSGSLDPAGVSEALRSQRGFAQPQARYGPIARYPAAAGQPAERLPELRTYRVPGPVPGIVRISPVDGATVLDGDAEGIAELAAVGGLRPDRALFYAGDLDAAAARGAGSPAAPASSSPTRTGAGCWRRISCERTRGRRSMPTIHSRASGRAWDSSARLGARPRPSPDIPACARRAVPSTAASRCCPSTGRSPRSTAGSGRAGWAGR